MAWSFSRISIWARVSYSETMGETRDSLVGGKPVLVLLDWKVAIYDRYEETRLMSFEVADFYENCVAWS